MRRASHLALIVGLAAVVLADRAHAQPAQNGWVVLSVEEYRSLRTRAFPPAPPAMPPAVDVALTRIDYELRVDDTAVGRVVLTIDVLAKGWLRVPIPSGVMVRDARLDGRPVALVDATPPYVLLSRQGRTVLSLDIVVPVARGAGAESIALPASPAPVARVALTLPKTGFDVAAAGAFMAEHQESGAESRWTAYGRPNQAIVITWKRKVDDRRAAQPLRLRARITEIVALGEETAQVSASVRLEIVQGLAREIAVAVPQDVAVNQVTGAAVADWEAEGGTLRVSLLEPAGTDAVFLVAGEMRAARDGTIAIPFVRVPAAERETGGVGVDVLGASEIRGRSVQGLEPADVSELGELAAGRASPSMMAFRLTPLTGTQPRSLNVGVVRYTPQAVLVANIEEARYRLLATSEGRLLVEACYAVRNNQRSFLTVSLPAGATVWTATRAGRSVSPAVGGAGDVLLPLEKGRAGQDAPTFLVRIMYVQRRKAWPDRGPVRLELPAVDLPISRTGATVYYPPAFDVRPTPGTFHAQADPGAFAEAFRAADTSEVEAAAEEKDTVSAGLQALVDRFNNDAGGRAIAGVLPVIMPFPEFGPSIFLASELTAESRAPTIEFAVKRK
jgi:hypothetical protein